MELGAFIQGAGGSAVDHALACLLGLLGLRVSEACGINIDDLVVERGLPNGHRAGQRLEGWRSSLCHPGSPGRSIWQSAIEFSGPLLLAQSGLRLNCHAATRIVRRLAKKAGITKAISAHSLRDSFLTAFRRQLPLRDVRIAARHCDPRTTTRYDKAQRNLDRHSKYIVTAFIAGSAVVRSHLARQRQ